jgi:hypothetical protein
VNGQLNRIDLKIELILIQILVLQLTRDKPNFVMLPLGQQSKAGRSWKIRKEPLTALAAIWPVGACVRRA